jgi:HPr kinase/phosphorylase
MTLIHATTVAVSGQGVLIVGPSGSGKSSLAIQLIALGAMLVADDQTIITAQGGTLIADVPSSIAGLIEARGVGLLKQAHAGPTPLQLVVDLGCREEKRLPERHVHVLEGCAMPCLHNPESPHFAQAILLYIKSTLGT